MALGVMVFDVLELACLAKCRGVVPVEVSNPAVEVWIAASNLTLLDYVPKGHTLGRLTVADVALEVLYVDGIETDDSCEETDIGFCDVG